MSKKQPRNTKGKIISAAWKLFYEQGYDDTTIDEIIAESATSKGSFYHYFEGKDALLGSLSFLFDEKYMELEAQLSGFATRYEQLIYLNQELFSMIENSISLDLLAQHSFGAKGSYLHGCCPHSSLPKEKNICWTATAITINCCAVSSGKGRTAGNSAQISP